MSEYLLDTWAWIEFYIGSEKGKKIYSILKSDKDCYTSIISIAELSDNFHSNNLKTDHRWAEIRDFIESNSTVLSMNADISSEAGIIKTNQREKFSDFGLMDAIILSTAREHGLKIITGDKHLKDKEKTEKLEEI